MFDFELLNKNMAEQLDYYNEDHGTELGRIQLGPYRAVCCNLAWCMVNADRFRKYAAMSEYWKAKLITSARYFIRDPSCINWGMFVTDEYRAFRMDIREYLMGTITRRYIYQNPQRLDYRLDIGTVETMLKQARLKWE